MARANSETTTARRAVAALQLSLKRLLEARAKAFPRRDEALARPHTAKMTARRSLKLVWPAEGL
jgi:hypothetical protein